MDTQSVQIKTERKPNKWISFLQEQAKKNKTSYAIELADKNNKEIYKSRNTEKPLSEKKNIPKEKSLKKEKKPYNEVKRVSKKQKKETQMYNEVKEPSVMMI